MILLYLAGGPFFTAIGCFCLAFNIMVRTRLIATCDQVDWNIVMINILKQLVRTRTDVKVDIVLYVASYNEIEQLQCKHY